jgi:hypothetical protein
VIRLAANASAELRENQDRSTAQRRYAHAVSKIDSAEGRRQSLAEFKMITASCPDVSTYELAALKPGDKLRQAGTCFSRLL